MRYDQERSKAGLERAGRQVERLIRLVGNLLDVSTIGGGRFKLQLAEVDSGRLDPDVVEQFSPDLSRAGCTVECHASVPVIGYWDPLRVTEVLTNLLSNACKYGARHPVEVRVDREDGIACLSVEDHGIGIAGRDLQRIFDRFERAVSPGHYGGLGLGLYISRKFVEAHGGKMAVTSAQNVGTTFRIELPIQGAAAAMAATSTWCCARPDRRGPG